MTTVSRAAKFAARTAHLRASTIREMLKVTQQPDVISFGGGLPAPELFPTQGIAQAAARVMERRGAAALQYSVTEGIPEMRALKNIDVAFVCMNLPYTMPPEEAADAVKAFHPKVVIPYHYHGSDLAVFEKGLEGTGIEVRLLDWYPK